jgi:heme A synthase
MTKSKSSKKKQKQGKVSQRQSSRKGAKTSGNKASSKSREKTEPPRSVGSDTSSVPSDSSSSVPWGKIFFTLFSLSMFLGILETTLQAGKAVPNWPHSFHGFWIFCPPNLWFTHGDVFIAQTHRLTALATIIFVIIAVVRKNIPRLRRFETAVLIAFCVILPLSGGLRIACDRLSWANLHACLAFAACAMLGRWIAGNTSNQSERSPKASSIQRFVLSCVLFFLFEQAIFGAQIRHLAMETDSDNFFTLWVWLHSLLGVSFLFVAAACYWVCVRGAKRHGEIQIARQGRVLVSLLIFQVLLGPINWFVNYNVPLWFMNRIWPIHYTIQEGTFLQTATTCTHVGVGYASVVIAAAAWTLARRNSSSPSNS